MLKIRSAALGLNVGATLLSVLVVALSGCHKKVERLIPKTYPVTGRVVASHGQTIPVGAMIEFRPEDAELVAKGIIEADGGFALTTLFYEQKLPGAAAGRYRATVLTVVNHHPGPTIELPDTYTVEPKENHFAVKLN